MKPDSPGHILLCMKHSYEVDYDFLSHQVSEKYALRVGNGFEVKINFFKISPPL
jgi:hypothetical protein